jgi:hypothetical protein
VHGLLEALGVRGVRVEGAIPIEPQPAGVGFERGHGDVRALERGERLPAIDGGRVADVVEYARRNADALRDQAAGDAVRVARQEVGQRPHRRFDAAHAEGEVRRAGRFGENVERLAEGARLRVDEMKRLAITPRQVREVIEGGGDEVDRDEVQIAALDAGQRQDGGKRRAELLEQGKEVVDPVHLVHLAAHGVPDDQGGPIDAPRIAQRLRTTRSDSCLVRK